MKTKNNNNVTDVNHSFFKITEYYVFQPSVSREKLIHKVGPSRVFDEYAINALVFPSYSHALRFMNINNVQDDYYIIPVYANLYLALSSHYWTNFIHL